jgi:hypothetical protein
MCSNCHFLLGEGKISTPNQAKSGTAAGAIWNGDPLEPPVIPAKAGIQSDDNASPNVCGVDSRFRGNDYVSQMAPMLGHPSARHQPVFWRKTCSRNVNWGREDALVNLGLLWAIIALPALGVAYLLFRIMRSYFKLRGQRLVTCPETQKPAAVDLDAIPLARSAAFTTPHLRLSECSRWPERQGCGQECLEQIEAAPEGCLVRRIVANWYADKTCAICGKPVNVTEEWVGHVPALLNPEKKTVYWDKIAVEKLPEVFQTHSPVCWSCHIAETFRCEHPDLVVDRPARW